MALNKVFLMGRLVRDPEVNYGAKMAVGRFTIAVDDPKRAGAEKAETNFIPCKAFGKTAELIGNYFQKGSRILVSDGRLDVKSYADKEGVRKTAFGVIVNSVEFVDSKSQGSYGGGTRKSSFDGMGSEEVDF